MQVRQTIKKVSATLGSTLLIGSTLGASASLADFPGMFVADDGTPTAQLVVGSQGKVSDVVSAVNVASALGQATMGVGERTEQVTASVNGGVGWSATDGRTLDTRNDNLYFGDQIDDVRQTLTGDHLDVLRTTTFQDDAGNSQDVEQYLYVGSQATGFGNPGDTSDRDPFLYVDNPSSISAGSGTGYLYKLQANFGEGLTLDKSGTESDGNADGNDDVLGQEVELFGKTFTISEDSFDSNNPGQLVLYGSSQEYDLETGQSTTVTINGEEHTLEVRAVTDSNTTAFYVDDQLKEKDEGATFSVDGQDVRVKDIIQTASDTSSGLVTFAIGSQKYVFEDGQPVQDGDGDEIEGTKVQLSGTNVAGGHDLSDQSEITVSSLEVAVGAADSGTGFVEAGSMFQDPVFDSLSFRFGGLSPDASGDSSMVEEVSFQQSDDETASVTFTPRGQSQTSVGFFHRDTNANANDLADSDGNTIVAVEGQAVQEDQYFTADAGGFSHLYQVTSIDVDAAASASGDEATVSLKSQLSGSTMDVDLKAAEDVSGYNEADNDQYAGTEVIDGQTYHFLLDTQGTSGTSDDKLYVTWGTDADFGATGSGGSGVTTAFPAIETKNGGLLGFYSPSQNPTDLGTDLDSFGAITNYLFTDDSTNAGTFESSDNVFTPTVVDDTGGADVSDGVELRTFKSNHRFIDPQGDNIGASQPIILDDGDGVLEDDGTDTVQRDGTAGSLTQLTSVTNLKHYEDASGTDAGNGASANADYDAKSSDIGEAIYKSSDGTLEDGDTRVSAVTINSGSDDTDVSTIDLGLSVNTAITSSTEPTDVGLSTTAVPEASGSGIDSTVWVDDSDTTGGIQSNDDVWLDLNDDGNIDSGPDILLYDGGETDISGSDVSPHETLSGTWEEGQDTTNSVDVASFDVGTNDASNSDIDLSVGTGSGGTNVIAQDLSGTTNPDVTIDGASGATDIIVHRDVDGTSSNLDSQDSVYIQLASGSTVSSDSDAGDVRIRGFTASYSAGSTVEADDAGNDDDMDEGVTSIEDFENNDRFIDGNENGDFDISSGSQEAIIQSSNDDYEMGDNLKVVGDLNNAFQSFRRSSSAWDVYIDNGNSDNTYESDEDILTLSAFGTTSGTVEIAADTAVTANKFASDVKFASRSDDAYDDDEGIVQDNDGSGDFTPDDDVLYTGSLTKATGVQYWSSEADEVDSVEGLHSLLPQSDPAAFFIEEKDSQDQQESYVVAPAWDGTDSEVEVGGQDTSAAVSFTGTRSRAQLNTDDNVYQSYDSFGTFVQEDTSGTGSVTINYPDQQAVAGAAFTGAAGGLSTGGTSSEQVSVTYTAVTNQQIRGSMPEIAAVDSQVSQQTKQNADLILVGGPAVNTLVADLASQGDTWTVQEWRNQHRGEALLQLVEDAFAQGQHALIVAGYMADDTARAAEYISDYSQHQSALQGKMTYTVSGD